MQARRDYPDLKLGMARPVVGIRRISVRHAGAGRRGACPVALGAAPGRARWALGALRPARFGPDKEAHGPGIPAAGNGLQMTVQY